MSKGRIEAAVGTGFNTLQTGALSIATGTEASISLILLGQTIESYQNQQNLLAALYFSGFLSTSFLGLVSGLEASKKVVNVRKHLNTLFPPKKQENKE